MINMLSALNSMYFLSIFIHSKVIERVYLYKRGADIKGNEENIQSESLLEKPHSNQIHTAEIKNARVKTCGLHSWDYVKTKDDIAAPSVQNLMIHCTFFSFFAGGFWYISIWLNIVPFVTMPMTEPKTTLNKLRTTSTHIKCRSTSQKSTPREASFLHEFNYVGWKNTNTLSCIYIFIFHQLLNRHYKKLNTTEISKLIRKFKKWSDKRQKFD